MAKKTNGETRETAAKILIYDTENSPNIIAAWGIFEQNALEVIKHRQIITVSWKWLGDKGKPQVVSLPDFPMYKKDPHNNIELMRHIHGLMEKADIVCGHNAGNFDDKRVNTDLIKHRLPPPPPHKVIDTLKIARKYFGFNQNSLKALAEFLGLPAKMETGGYSLWKACMAGDMKAWAKMSRYCAQDTATLEALYMRLRPWDQGHPAVKPRGDAACPRCQSKNLINRGVQISRTGKTPRYQCKDCGHWSTAALIKKAWVIK